MRKLTIHELNRLSVEDFKTTEKFPVCVVLDNVRSLHNVGAAFRTCDAFAVQKLWLGGITGRPPHREITKTALGSDESVPWEHAPDVPALAARLRAEGWQVVAVEQTTDSVPLPAFRPESSQPLALIFGNEVFGVDDAVLAHCDAAVEIPQFGTKHSLNVSVTVGVVVWDVLGKLGAASAAGN